MTTPIQAAIEALTRIKNECIANGGPSDDHGHILASNALAEIAALQAESAQGSIDTDAFRMLLAQYYTCDEDTEAMSMEAKIIAHIDAHIAQRAASGDLPEGFALVPLRVSAEMSRVMEDDDWAWGDLLAAAGAITEEQYELLSAPAPIADDEYQSVSTVTGAWRSKPIADEVAGEWVLVPIAPTEEMILATRGPNMSEPSWNSYARKRHATLYKQMIAARPPAPRTSAPDAPAGDLPVGSVITAGQILAADRRSNMSDDEALRFGRIIESMALRAAAAPAGHAAAEKEDWFTLTIEPIDPAVAKYTYDNYKVVGTFKVPAIGDQLVKITLAVNADDQLLLGLMEEYYGIGFNDGEWRGERWESYKAEAEKVLERFRAALAKRNEPAGHAEPVADVIARAANIVIKMTKPPGDWLGKPTERMESLAATGKRIADKILAIAAPVAAEPAPRPKYDWCPECHARDSMPEPEPQVIYREPTLEERHLDGVAKLMASADKFGGDHE